MLIRYEFHIENLIWNFEHITIKNKLGHSPLCSERTLLYLDILI